MLDALTLKRATRNTPWLPRLVLLGVGVFCIWKAVELLWLALAGPRWPAPPPVDVPNLAARPANAPGTLAKWHLFGHAPSAQTQSAAQAAQARETTLKLTLRGTFNESRPEGGIAIIADEQGVDRTYRVGDTLPGQAKLEAIHAGQVLLLHGDSRQTLSLRPDQAQTSGTRTAAPPPTASGAALPGANPPTSAPRPVTPALAPGGPDMQTWRAANLPNMQELARQVQVMPVLENGRMRGVRLAVGRDSDLLGRVGLEPTDIITSVNGIPLDKPERQAELIRNLQGARQVQVEVERDGKPVKIQVAL